MAKYTLYTKGSPDRTENRKILHRLFHRTPLPDEHLMVNLGLYTRASVMAKYYYLNELYQRIIPLPGVIMEFGTWYGQNIVQFMNLRAIWEPYNYTRRVIGFDTFSGYRGITASDGKSPYVKSGHYTTSRGYLPYIKELLDYHEKENPLPHIKKYELVAGDASVTVKQYLKKHPETVVALAYFDMQLYKPTKACLAAIRPHLIKGSVIAMDELATPEFPGETKAYKEIIGLTSYPIYRSRVLPDRSYAIVP